jgi:hypothetical protein
MASDSPKQSDQKRHGTADAAQTGRTQFLLGGSVLAGLALLAFALSLTSNPSALTAFFLYRQDRWLLLIGAGLLSAIRISRREQEKPFSVNILLPLIVAAALLIFCLFGHYWILSCYDLSRDEQMAVFDASVFSKGEFVHKIPLLWRDHADALNTIFMYPAVHRGAWISSYLPFNALLRALLGLVGASMLAGPLMTAIGALALWGCARRIWPHDREAPVVALLLYVGSGQVVVTGMTSYAMPAHLACNLAWLWLFLRGTRWADAAALAVGFVAVGLHQPLMHPMFAAPLLFQLLRDKQWLRAAFYAFGYAAIGVFWLWWPGWTWSLVQTSLDAQPPAGVDYATRFIATVRDGNPARWPDMIANLLRFLAWQHLLLLPLMMLGWNVVRRDRLAVGLAMGVLVTIVTMAAILPYQGHGFGYRYLHGLIGNCILLAVYGWTSLDQRSEWRALLLRASVASCLVLVPFQLWMAHGLYAPAAAANARLAEIRADYVVIGGANAPFAQDLVLNPPALDTRPVRLFSERLDQETIVAICRSHPRVALLGDRLFDKMNAYFGLAPKQIAAKRNHLLVPWFKAAGCRTVMMP